MIKKHTALTSLCLLIALGGCVTVNLGGTDTTKAKDVKYAEPASPFAKADVGNVDHAWHNIDNGNSISYVSDCGDPSDPSLVNIEREVTAGLRDVQTERTETLTFQGREARRSKMSGKVDGIQSLVDLLIFKKNNCIYILTYVGLPQHFDTNKKDFDKFIKEFEVP